MKVKIPQQKYGITELYDTIATTMGFRNVSDLEYDCCKVNIAKNIQDGIYDKYLELGKENGISEHEVRLGVTMLLVVSGPKVDESLADNEVEVFDGFICEQKGA